MRAHGAVRRFLLALPLAALAATGPVAAQDDPLGGVLDDLLRQIAPEGETQTLIPLPPANGAPEDDAPAGDNAEGGDAEADGAAGGSPDPGAGPSADPSDAGADGTDPEAAPLPEDGPLPEGDALPEAADIPAEASAEASEPIEAPAEPEAEVPTGPEAPAYQDAATPAVDQDGAADSAPDGAGTAEPDAPQPESGASDTPPAEAAPDTDAAPPETAGQDDMDAVEAQDEPDAPDGDAPSLAAEAEAPLPTARSFRMGFTPLPYDLTPEAFAETYIRIGDHGDIVSHLLDEGVPWRAAASGTTFHPNVEADIARRLSGTRKNSAVFLSVTPLAQDRISLAGEWAESGGMPLPEDLQGRPFDDPDVVSAFVGYALRMIDRFDPDYFAYAVEISDLSAAPEARAAFVGLAGEVYRAVKRVHPDLPVFPTCSLGNRFAFTDDLRSFVEELAPFTDILAVSTYPYVWDGVGGDADRIPADWFSKIADVLPDKPFAIAQTGFLSGTYRNLPSLVWISAGPEDQAAYLSELFQEAERLEAQFVIWYVPVDYDRLWDRLESMGMSQWFAQWMRTGLWSADFQPRPALKVWTDWLALPVWE